MNVPWAAKAGVPITCEVDVQGMTFDKGAGHVHFVWLFGDEVSRQSEFLSYNTKDEITYNVILALNTYKIMNIREIILMILLFKMC